MRNRRRNKRYNKIILLLVCLMFIMTAGYAAFSTEINVNVKGNIKDSSRVIKSWSNTDKTDFHSDYYKENIVSATFLDTNTVPKDAIESWDVSEDKKGGVMAYVIPTTLDNTKFDLYIGAKDGVIANPDSSYLFNNFIGIESFIFNNNFDTSQVTSMGAMFANCISLTSLDLTSFNTSNVITMDSMFTMWNHRNEEVSLKKIDVSGWDTSNVINMRDMFSDNKELVEIIGLEGFNTSKVTDMWAMFSDCQSLTSLNLKSFDTSNVTHMYLLFYGCRSLTELDLCNFDTRKVTTMNSIFYNTHNISQIKVGDNWSVQNVTDTSNILSGAGVSSLTTGQC